MKLNKKCFVRFGHYSAHPKDEEAHEMNFPEDTLFFTGGDGDIGSGKHEGAFHVLAMTKASDSEIRKVAKQGWAASVVTFSNDRQSTAFRVNGYAFIELPDCISDEFEFTDADKINELLDLENHPVYVVLLNDEYMISNITRIDRINSVHMVNSVCIQLYSQIGSRYYPMVHPATRGGLFDILHPFYKFTAYIPEESYGKELFDELLYTSMSIIYPEYKSKLKGFDLEYINRQYSNILNRWNNAMEKLRKDNEISDDLAIDAGPQLDNIRKFIEKLPLKNEQ